MQEQDLPSAKEALVIVALSGGADSMALCLILLHLGYAVHIAHLDHALRDESLQEAKFVEDFAKKLSLPSTIERQEVKALAKERGIGLEEAGRLARYAFFDRVQKKITEEENVEQLAKKEIWLATGHHLNDLAEDKLMRLLRGAAWPALGGMRALVAEQASLSIMRPLLHTSKEDLVDFLKLCGQDWCEDASNNELDFTRNRVRHTLMPLFLAENPQFLSHTKQLWQQAQDDKSYWNDEIKKAAEAIVLMDDGFFLPRFAFKDKHKALRLRLYAKLLSLIDGASPRASNLHALDAARSQTGKCFQFAKANIFVKKKGLLALANTL